MSKQIVVFGSSSQIGTRGLLSEIDLRSAGKVWIAIIMPRSIHVANSADARSGNHGDDVHCWTEERIVQLQNPDQAVPIDWIYCTNNQRLVVNGRSYSLPIGSMGILRFDSDCKLKFELREYSAEEVGFIRSSIGITNLEEAVPAKRLP